MSNVEIRVCVGQLICFRIGVNGGEAEIPDMIWPTHFIQQYVPVGPADGTIVEVIGVPYGSRTRVAAVKEKRPIVTQWNLAAGVALYRI